MAGFMRAQRTPVIHQAQAADCGLACIAMVAGHHGHHIDLPGLRARCSVSMKGSTLAELMQLGSALDLAPRALSLDLDALADLQLPCVLHWDFNHFVVLVRVRAGALVVHDPALGRRVLSRAQFSRHFTGVALELQPTSEFDPQPRRAPLRIAALLGRPPRLRAAIVQLLVLALVLQLFTMTGPFYLQWVVDQALVPHDRGLVRALGLGFLLLIVLQTGVAALRSWILAMLGTTLNLHMMTNVFRHLIRLPMQWFATRHVGDVLSRFDSLGTIQRTLTRSFLEALVDGAMAVATLTMMLAYSPRLTLIALAAAASYALLRLALYRPLRRASEEQMICGARQQSHFLESVRAMQCVKLFCREDQRLATWQNLAVDEFNAEFRKQRIEVVYKAFNGLLFGIENVLTIWVGALLVLDGGPAGFSVGMLLAFIAYKVQFVDRMAALIENGMQLRMLGLHTERVADVVSSPAEAADPAPGRDPAELAFGLRLSGVAFRYADADPMLFENVELQIAPGESVAIVGPSGCGKSTLMKLMLGLLEPTAGSVSMGGVPLARIGRARYRQHVASVMQDDVLFAGSIGQNISFFDAQPDPARIEDCARLAAVHDDIVAMPMRYGTLVGDMGTVLSGGQKQRVLLARALYRRPRILFLDESTSHLDLAKERSVNAAIAGLKLTRVIIAHRPETIASADRVVVLRSDGAFDAAQASSGPKAMPSTSASRSCEPCCTSST